MWNMLAGKRVHQQTQENPLNFFLPYEMNQNNAKTNINWKKKRERKKINMQWNDLINMLIVQCVTNIFRYSNHNSIEQTINQ